MAVPKFLRQSKILDIIKANDIETQEELSARLQEAGYSATQATISRDIRELKLIKALTAENKYKYALPGGTDEVGYSGRLRTIFHESVTSCERAQNIVVIKTLPGLAMAACAALDSMNMDSLVGTLAGDDTAFLALRDNESAREMVELIRGML